MKMSRKDTTNLVPVPNPGENESKQSKKSNIKKTLLIVGLVLLIQALLVTVGFIILHSIAFLANCITVLGIGNALGIPAVILGNKLRNRHEQSIANKSQQRTRKLIKDKKIEIEREEEIDESIEEGLVENPEVVVENSRKVSQRTGRK